MIREAKVIYTASDDPQFERVEDKVIVLTPDIVAERYDETEVVFYVTDANQEVLTIDRATCPRFLVDFDQPVEELSFEQLTQFTFLDFIRNFAK